MVVVKPLVGPPLGFSAEVAATFIEALDNDSLFIFPDNVLDHELSCPDEGIYPGFRPYNRHGCRRGQPRTAGVPVAWSPWEPLDYFEELNHEVRTHIKNAVLEIRDLVTQYGYNNIVFFAVETNHGPPRFSEARAPTEILQYISQQLYSLSSS